MWDKIPAMAVHEDAADEEGDESADFRALLVRVCTRRMKAVSGATATIALD